MEKISWNNPVRRSITCSQGGEKIWYTQ